MGIRDIREIFRGSPEELGDNGTLLEARAENALAKLEQYKIDLEASTEGTQAHLQHKVDQAQKEYDTANSDLLADKATRAHIALGKIKMEFMAAKEVDRKALQSKVDEAQKVYDQTKAALDASFPKPMPESPESENH